MADLRTPWDAGPYREEEALKLRNIGSLGDYEVGSVDGPTGTIREFLFDDEIWAVRFIVLDAGDWLPGRKILISPLSIDEPEWDGRRLPVPLTRAQLMRGPTLGVDDPVSRLHQIDLYAYYGWPPYWIEEEYYEIPPHPSNIMSGLSQEQEKARDPHLFSTHDTIEYRIEALDGDIGYVTDFIFDEDDWVIYYFVVDITENEHSRSVLISTEWIQRIVLDEERVYVELDRETVRSSPEYDPAVPITREYELELYDHYGRPRYWEQGGDTEDEEDTRFSS